MAKNPPDPRKPSPDDKKKKTPQKSDSAVDLDLPAEASPAGEPSAVSQAFRWVDLVPAQAIGDEAQPLAIDSPSDADLLMKDLAQDDPVPLAQPVVPLAQPVKPSAGSDDEDALAADLEAIRIFQEEVS